MYHGFQVVYQFACGAETFISALPLKFVTKFRRQIFGVSCMRQIYNRSLSSILFGNYFHHQLQSGVTSVQLACFLGCLSVLHKYTYSNIGICITHKYW